MISTYFLGACGPQGFHSHYDSLLQELENLTVIKGGSGCGKSTFMKKIGAAAEASGLDVSYILCSSDPDSLDAVLLPSLSLGFVDGTDLPTGIPGIELIEPVLDSGEVIVDTGGICGIIIVRNGNVPDTVLRECEVGVQSG